METKNIQAPSCANCITCSQSIFSVFKGDELAKLSAKKHYQLYKMGQYIFKEGAEPRGIHCIHDGNVKITKASEEGKEQIVRLAKPGNYIGYRALLCNDIYQASAMTLEDTHVCFYPKEVYFELLYSKPEVAAQTINILSRDLRFAENMMLNMAQKNVRGRVAEILLILEEFYGIYDKDGTIKSRENISTNAIADQMSTRAATVTDMVQKLHEKKLVRYEKYKGVGITDKGRKVALAIIRKHRLWEVFLVKILNFKWKEEHVIAEQMEHVHSDVLTARLDKFLGYPKFDPHGDPIPDELGKVEPAAFMPLFSERLNQTVKLAGVA